MTTDVSVASPHLHHLRDLTDSLAATASTARVVAATKNRQPVTLDGVVGSSCALITAAIACHCPAPLVVMCPGVGDAEAFLDDAALFTERPLVLFPAWQTHIQDALVYDATYGERLRVLKQLSRPDWQGIVVAPIHSCLQPVPHPAILQHNTRRIRVGEQLPRDELAEWLTRHGFHATSGVELPGEYSRRGGILDLFTADRESPIRLEWFDDEIESIRRFDIDSQRSLESLADVDVTVFPTAGDDPMRAGGDQRGHLLDYLDASGAVVWLEPEQIARQAAQLWEHLANHGACHPLASVLERAAGFGRIEMSTFAAARHACVAEVPLETVERFRGSVEQLRQELDRSDPQDRVLLVCSTESECQRLHDLLQATAPARDQRLDLVVGSLRHGFHLLDQRVIVLNAGECLLRDDVRRKRRRHLSKRIDSFLDLKPGELVVHLAHGIGRFRGMEVLPRENQTEEHLVVEFAGGTRVYVPSTRIHFVQKYVGGRSARPRLATLGGVQWQKRKQAAESAVTDLAQELLAVQAARASRPGIAFRTDSEWQAAFDASFPYEETDDQWLAIDAIKRDMELARPMDRLLCGDVGFGKTEVAIRAAFKAVDNGYQVAVLVPTTVLAEQHFRTFHDRMAEYPFTIERLSRFCSVSEQRRTLESLASGGIDIVIGTHRLASQDVMFQNLGLLIIDEEQRFGVEIKERLKMMRSTVDVLTMTATPIPRTLHMSLTGMRDISNLEQAPADRTAVETRLTRWDEQLVRRALLRELDRGGQIFFVHNRIADIVAVHSRLASLVPEARIRVAHGRMPEDQLEEVMTEFVAGHFDLLLATTIVESGLDIPNANTIFIDDAERYGLAELHQLRGRVGRYNRLAYCYLLVDPRKHITPEAARRLRAIEEFSHMGAGFTIAMRDLEFRGAGNVLGSQQSGHIAAVGYELYCELLEVSVRRLQSLPPKLRADVNIDLPGEAYLPDEYVTDQRTKIDLYRRLVRVESPRDLAELADELRDRFGPLPPTAERLLALAGLRIEAAVWRIEDIHLEYQQQLPYLVLRYTDAKRVRQLAKASQLTIRVVDESSAYHPLARDACDPESILQAAMALFRVPG